MGKKKRHVPRAPVVVSGLSSKKIRREAVEVVRRAFTDVPVAERALMFSRWREPVFDPEHTRVAISEGRAVSVILMAPRMMRFGPVKVPAMTVGPVATHDRYRKRGYCAAAMNDASAYMKENGFLLAYLGGVPNFYYRFGYYPYMSRGNVEFKREEAGKEARAGRLRAMTRKDLPRVRRLYDEVTAERICAAARDDKVWDWLIGPGGRASLFEGPKMILDARGRLCGYLTMKPKAPLQVHEIVVRQDEAGCRAALGALVREARRHELKEVTLPLPWDDALAVVLRQYVGAEFKLWAHPTGGALMKIVDFPGLMRRLQPLFARRWRRAGKALPTLRFTLSSEIGAAGFTVERGGVRVSDPLRGSRVRIPQRWLSGLITGYHAVRDIARRRGASVPTRLMSVLEVLFPHGWPFVYKGDSY